MIQIAEKAASEAQVNTDAGRSLLRGGDSSCRNRMEIL